MKYCNAENISVETEDIAMNGIVTQSVDLSTIEVNDWLIVRYPLDNKESCYKQYIGQVIEKLEGKFRMDCLRSKRTTQFSGYVFHRPNVPDNETWVDVTQIVSKVDEPEKYQRALKFNVSFTECVKG